VSVLARFVQVLLKLRHLFRLDFLEVLLQNLQSLLLHFIKKKKKVLSTEKKRIKNITD